MSPRSRRATNPRCVQLLVAGVICAGMAGADPLTVTVAEHQVWVRGVTPGARVTLFGAGWGQGTISPFLFQWAGLGQDDDNDGAVQIIPPTGHGYDTTVSHSVWAAVDLSTGTWGKAVLSLGSSWAPWTEVGLGGDDLVRDPLGFLAICPAWAGTVRESSWEVALSRPGRGMWTGASVVGDACAALIFAELTPVGDSGAPPERLVPGDVLVAVNAKSYGYMVEAAALELVRPTRVRLVLR